MVASPYQRVQDFRTINSIIGRVGVFFGGVSGESFLGGYSVWFHVVSLLAVDLVYGMGLTYFDRCTPLMRGIPAVVLLHCCCVSSHVLHTWPWNQSNQSNSVSGFSRFGNRFTVPSISRLLCLPGPTASPSPNPLHGTNVDQSPRSDKRQTTNGREWSCLIKFCRWGIGLINFSLQMMTHKDFFVCKWYKLITVNISNGLT